MESTVHSPKTRPAAKTYKHFTINFSPVQETISSKKTEFFYIGKNAKKIDSLIEVFESGYAADSVSNALTILKRLTDKSSIIDVIVVDAALGPASLHELYSHLSANPVYAFIPLVVEASELCEAELKAFRDCKFLDEIIFLKRNNEKLVSKVEFLKKVKAQANQQLKAKNIQTSMNAVCDSGSIMKRAFDVLVSSIAILLLSPVFLLIALAVRIESKGPIFYIAKRAGRGYRIFNFYKFRTMVVDADKKVKELSHLNQYNGGSDNGPVFFKISNDPRITKIGAFLRNSSLDELPQLFNVFLGDMSLVGNRPLPLYEAATLTTDEWAARFMAPAGITGLWQIKKRGQDDMSVEERIGLDIDYAHKYNFMYDLWIMANTPSALLQKSNV